MGVKNITSPEAYALLKEQNEAVLVDVRTENEWKSVGYPDLDGKGAILLSLRSGQDMAINPEFLAKLEEKIPDKDALLLFICRSGGRSAEAASYCLREGYANCYNVIDGFEGGMISKGWKRSNLPWQVL